MVDSSEHTPSNSRAKPHRTPSPQPSWFEDSRTDRYVDHESMALELDSVLNKVLKDREITIIRECFGIGQPEKGLEEIGDRLGLTRERVRQIREKSIAKLRDSGNAKILMKYLG